MKRTAIVLAAIGILWAVLALPATATDENQAEFWNDKWEHPAQCYKHEGNSSHGYVTEDNKGVVLYTFNPAWWGDHWEGLVIKGGSVDRTIVSHPSAGVRYESPDNAAGNQAAVSHWIVCKGRGESGTTTTTMATTTTSQATTTTTTEPPSTTTSTSSTTSSTTSTTTSTTTTEPPTTTTTEPTTTTSQATTTTLGTTTSTTEPSSTTTSSTTPTSSSSTSTTQETPDGGVAAGGGGTSGSSLPWWFLPVLIWVVVGGGLTLFNHAAQKK